MIRKHNRSLTREQALAQSVLSGNTGTVYFTTDSHTIIMNGVEYSKSDLKNLEGYFTDDNAKFNYRSTAGSQSVAGQANGDLATIEALYGDSLVWNQIVKDGKLTNNTSFWTKSLNEDEVVYDSNGVTLTKRNNASMGAILLYIYPNLNSAHKYYLACFTKSIDGVGCYLHFANARGLLIGNAYAQSESSSWTKISLVTQPVDESVSVAIRVGNSTAPSGASGMFKDVMCIDLSLMFGLGKEPTLAEFETFLANYFPRHDYAYNEGEILSIKSNGIKTVGFNLWDEEWEVGGIKIADGTNYNAQDRIRSKNYIRVLPTTYYLVAGNATYGFRVFYYDSQKNFISTEYWNSKSTKIFTNDVCYIRFFLASSVYGTTYNNDICINLAWSGNRNGEYEEHWEETTPIPITTLEGTKSDGTREVIFPDGLCGIGDYKDEIKGNKAIKRIGRVDLSQFSWFLDSYTGDDFRGFICSGLRATIENSSIIGIIRVIHSKYTATTAYSDATCAAAPDKSISQKPNGGSLFIKDSSYTSASAFKASLQGVYAYYVLAEPIEYTLDNEFKIDYKVDDYGTEEILPENGTAPTSLPIIADIRYGINAVDTLARLHKDYVSVYPQSFNDEQKEQARKNIGVNDTLDGNSLDFGVVQNGDGSIELDLDVSTIGGESKQKTIELPVATSNHNGLMSKEDKVLLGNHTTALASDEARLDALDKTYETEGEFGFRHSGGSDIYDVNAGVGRISRLVGNSVNWHQLAPELTSENYGTASPAYTSPTFSTEQGRKIVTLTALQDVSSSNFNLIGLLGNGSASAVWGVTGHYYLWTMDVCPSMEMRLGVGTSNTNIENVTVSKTNGYTRIYGRSYADGSGSCILRTTSAVPQGATLKVKDIQMYDLTMMFGQGKEPTTAQMKTWLETYHRRYDYAREEKIIGFDPKEIVTQGSNLIFDNATVFPNFSSKNMDVVYKGEDITVTIKTVANNYLGNISSDVIGATLTAGLQVNCIRVEPNTKYRISLDGEDADKVGRIFYNFLDATYKLLDTGNGLSYKPTPTPNLYFTTSAETYYVKIRLDFRNAGSTTDYLVAGTYTFRVSLHKEGDGGKNDVVEKYWKKTKALTAPSTLKREDGTLIFPDGLMAIGDYKDEIVDGKAIKRIIKVDLGSLTWVKSGSFTTFSSFCASLPDAPTSTKNLPIMCLKYAKVDRNISDISDGFTLLDKTMYGYFEKSRVYITDSAYSDAATFKAAMNGVYAYYVLNDPEVIEIGDVYDDAYQVDPYGTETLCDDANGNVDCYGSTKVKYGVDTAEDVGELFLARANACATAEQNGLMSAADKQSLDLNNTPMRLMILQDQRNSAYNLCVSANAARFIDAGYKPVIYRRMKVKRHFAFNDLVSTRVWKWVPCEEVVLTSLETSGHQSEYMKIGVPNLLRRKHIIVDTHNIYIGGSYIPMSDWFNALGVWNYGSPSHLDDNNHYYAAKDFVIESCPDYIVDYSQSTHKYSQTDSYVYAHHGAARKTLYAGGSALKPFKMTLQYGFAFVEDSDITSKRVTDIIPFQLVHTPLKSGGVTSANKYARWKFRLR